jgi:predicted O-methyltransferase YrrM
MKLTKILSGFKYINFATVFLWFSRNGSPKKFLGLNRLEYYNQKKSGLLVIRFYDAFPNCQNLKTTIQILIEEKTGGLSTLDLQYLSSIVKCYPIKTIFEIGTFDGCAATHMMMNTQFPEQCSLYTLDLPSNETDSDYGYDPGNSGFWELRRAGYYINRYTQSGITQLFGDSLEFDFSPYFASMDLIFIDGNHNMPYIQKDTENALKMLKSNGVIVWHDYYGIPGEAITDYLNQLSKGIQIFRIEKTSLAFYQNNG